MIRLYIRNYLLLILVLIVIVSSIASFILYNNQSVVDKNAQMIADGAFNYLSEKFKNIPKNQWKSYIDNLQKHSKLQKIEILSYNQLPTIVRSNPLLKEGRTVAYQALDITSALDSLYQEKIGYKQINQTNEYFAMEMLPPEILEYKYHTQWMQITIHELFKDEKIENYPKIAKKASSYFHVPVTISKFSKLNQIDQQNLLKWGILAISYDESHIVTLRFLAPNKNYVITIGKLRDSFLARHLLMISICIAMIVLLIISFFWSYPFYHSLNKLQKQAIDYGNGKFDIKLKISKTLVLSPLNEGLHKMADQIKILIASHKELTNAIAHEIKTPLARVRFTLSVLKQKYKNVDQKYIDNLDEDIAILDDLVNEILLHAKFDRKGVILKKEEINLNKFLEEKINWFSEKYSDKQWIFNNSMTEIIHPLDQVNFDRAMDNLLNNAYQYGGDKITVSLEDRSGTILISVEDNGIGILCFDRDKIFQPFERLSNSRNKEVQGHGLGLAITKKIIEAHSGRIYVTNTESKHTVFIIEFLKTD